MNDNARRIVRLLADGIDPITGEALPNISPYNQPQVIRALFALLDGDAASSDTPNKKIQPDYHRDIPPNHGKPWDTKERFTVATLFSQGIPLKDIAIEMERTTGSIRSELIKQGLIDLRPQPSVIPA